MIITKQDGESHKTYIQVCDIDYLCKLRISLPMTIYLKWKVARKDEYNFIEISESEYKFIKDVFSLLFSFDAYNSNPNKYLTKSDDDVTKLSSKDKYYLKNIRYILTNKEIIKNHQTEKKKMLV